MSTIRHIAARIIPQRFKLLYFIHKKSRRRGRAIEKNALRLLCDRDKNAVDVGANIGTIAYFLSKYSRATHAFEINPVLANKLERARLPNTRVYRVGLSNASGTARLRVPVAEFGPVFGSGTIETANDLDGTSITERDVPVATLDSFSLQEIGIIKIDVEGHELAVLQGAAETLRRNRPSLIIEILERLNGDSFAEILRCAQELSYKCYQLLDDGFSEVSSAKDEKHNNDYYFLQQTVVDRVNAVLRGKA